MHSIVSTLENRLVVVVANETHMTLQAPHPPSAHPSLDPLRFMPSRRNDRRVWFDRTFDATSSGTLVPLT